MVDHDYQDHDMELWKLIILLQCAKMNENYIHDHHKEHHGHYNNKDPKERKPEKET